MASTIIMPKQGLLMTEGTLVGWLAKEGDKVTEGEPLFEMETDKLTITMDSTATGTLLAILHPEGDVVPVTEPIAIVGEPGEDISDLLGHSSPAAAREAAAGPSSEPEAVTEVTPGSTPAPVIRETVAAPAAGGKTLASPRARLRAEEAGIDIATISGTGESGMVIERDVENYLASAPAATPLAKNLANAQGVDLSAVSGTGVGGKVTAADVTGGAAAPAAAATPVDGQATRGVRRERMSGMRKAICNNMLASKQTNAQTNHRMSIEMTEVIKLRNKYKALEIKVSFNDIIVRACAKALAEMPIMNASMEGDEIIYHDYVNVGTAVAVPNGLIVPVIRDADIIGITGIAAKSQELIGKAREGQLTDQDYHGGTFTVSSLGMFDIDDFVAIINPPESAILAVGKIAKTPVVRANAEGEDEIVIRSMCNMCLSYDHRIIDGAVAAEFLKKLKTYLECPELML